MTTTHYLHPSAKALTGARLGLGWLDRLEALGITKASAVPHHTHESMEVLCCLKGVIGYTFDRWPSVTNATSGPANIAAAANPMTMPTRNLRHMNTLLIFVTLSVPDAAYSLPHAHPR